MKGTSYLTLLKERRASCRKSCDVSGLNILSEPIRSTPVASDSHDRKPDVETRWTEDTSGPPQHVSVCCSVLLLSQIAEDKKGSI